MRQLRQCWTSLSRVVLLVLGDPRLGEVPGPLLNCESPSSGVGEGCSELGIKGVVGIALHCYILVIIKIYLVN